MADPKQGVVYTRTHEDPVWRAPSREAVDGAAEPALVAGAAVVGTTTYSAPEGAMYVAPDGNNTNPGTLVSPKATLAGAISAATTGSTIVLRAGEYHEEVTVPSTKTLTIQAYPDEAVWFDGSTVYTQWSGTGPWTAPLGVAWSPIDSAGYNQEGDGLANLPEQVWFDGVAQTQVADNTIPGAGQFSVDRTTDVLTVGSDPVGSEVRVAEQRVWMIAAGRVDLKGFGVRRYSPSEVEGSHAALIYVAGTANDSTMENMVFRDSGMHGLSISRPTSLANVTVEECNNAGIQVTTADGSVIERFMIRQCNLGGWQREPITAAIKITRTDNILIRNGLVDTVYNAFGVWFDVSCTRFIVANVSVNATDIAFESELSGGGFYDNAQHHSWFVNCRTTNAADWSMKIFDTDYVTVANCDFDAVRVPINVQQDERYNVGDAGNKTFEIVPWVSGHNRLWNNKIIGSPSVATMIAYHDPATPVPNPDTGANEVILGWGFFDEIAGNWVPTVPPGNMIQMGRIDGTRLTYNTWELAATSPSEVGGPPGEKLGTNHQGSTIPSDIIAIPLPEDIANVLGVAPGIQHVGAIVPALDASF